MNEGKRRKVEERLLEERRSVLEALGQIDERARDTIGTDDGELSNYRQHPADEGTDTMELEKSFLLASQEGRRLIQIDDALRRLNKEGETFGSCSVCGREISDERLELLPWTSTCSEHAGQDDTTPPGT